MLLVYTRQFSYDIFVKFGRKGILGSEQIRNHYLLLHVLEEFAKD
jgi:hypothetical protein